MLYVKDKIMKLNGKVLAGQVGSVEIEESGNIQEKTDKKGRIKKTQAVGYNSSKVYVNIILEDTKDQTCLQQLQSLEKIFRATKQKNPKSMKVVNEDCAARGINKVYIKDFKSKYIVSESKRTATLELAVPGTASLHVLKKVKGSSSSSSKKKKKNNKSKKNKNKSPAKDNKSTSAAKKKAKKLTK